MVCCRVLCIAGSGRLRTAINIDTRSCRRSFSARASRSSATKGGELGGGKFVIIVIIMGVVAGSRQSSYG
jgi:hypothetical protein